MKKLLQSFGFNISASTTKPKAKASTMKEYIVADAEEMQIIFDMFYGFIFRRTGTAEDGDKGVLYVKCSDKERERIENSGNHITLTLKDATNRL